MCSQNKNYFYRSRIRTYKKPGQGWYFTQRAKARPQPKNRLLFLQMEILNHCSRAKDIEHIGPNSLLNWEFGFMNKSTLLALLVIGFFLLKLEGKQQQKNQINQDFQTE